MEKLSLVVLKDEWKDDYKFMGIHQGDRLIYLGDIVQMPGHGVFLVHWTEDPNSKRMGKIISGIHTDSFRELTEEEM